MKKYFTKAVRSLDCDTISYDGFGVIFMTILNWYAKKIIRGNNAPFMNKTLSKEFMHRSKSRNNYYKYPTDENNDLYKKQSNYCVGLLKRKKKNY